MADVEKILKDAHKFLAQEDFKKAYNKFKKALEEDPESAEAHFGMAESGMFVPKLTADEIVESYKRAVEFDPENAFYLLAMGSFSLESGKFGEAEGAYNRAAELDPDNAPEFFSEFGVKYSKLAPLFYEQYLDEKTQEMIDRKSLQYMLKAIELDPDRAKKML